MKSTKRTTINKSESIREYAAANPTANVPAIVKHLASQGIKVSTPLAYQALKASTPKKKRGRPAKVGVGAKPVKSSSNTSSASILEATLAFIKQAGSIDRAIETLKILKQIG